MSRRNPLHHAGFFLQRIPRRSWIFFLVLALPLSLWTGKAAFALIGSHEQGGGTVSHSAGHLVRQPTAVTNGLVAWYPLDGNANDYSGNGNNGTLNNFTFDNTTNGWTGGKFGNALLFDGISTYGLTASSVTIGTTSTTESMWVKTTSSQSYMASVSMANNLLRGFGLNSGQVWWSRSSNQDYFSTKAVNDGRWHHVVAVVSGTTLTFYIDGAVDSTDSIGSLISNSAPLYLGRIFGTFNVNDHYFSGTLDDVRIYNRALSQTEITQLYQGSQPVNCDQYCMGWWKLDGTGTSTSARDAANHGNNGTLTNFTFDGTTNGWTSGVFGNGLLFSGPNGSSESLSIPDNATLDPTNAITVSAWVNFSTPLTTYPGIVSKFGAAPYQYRLSLDLNQQPAFTINNASAAIINTSLLPNTWYFLVGTYDRTSVKVYVNGNLLGSAAYTAAINTNTVPVVIGQDTCCGNTYRHWNGSIDDVRIYNRALTDYEIYEQYSAGH